MKPLIGVTQTLEKGEDFFKVSRNNMLAILRAGGIPIALPYTIDADTIYQITEKIDGLYLTGGDDVDPIIFQEEPHPKLGAYHPERDRFEIEITKEMLHQNKPILGVCKGAQMLNLASGGNMYQDIYTQISHEVNQHTQKSPRYTAFHHVNLQEGSLVHRLTNKATLRVNSIHHQANHRVGNHFKVTGVAFDGVVEVIESCVHDFALGLQWHPEMMAVEGGDEVSQRIYKAFITACQSKD